MTNETLFVRLLCDVMIPAELAEALRTQGYDVAEARLLSLDVQQNDEVLLDEAARQDRAVVTCNYSDPHSNFCVIHEEWQSQGKEHAGIILVPQHQVSSRSHRWQVRDRLLKFLNCYSADELRNQLWWLPQS
jgi:predicted nuclease of predicted toxin-antitoxin system